MWISRIPIIFVAICYYFASAPASYAWQHYDLPIYAFGVSNLQLSLDLEKELIIPSRSGKPFTDSNILAIVPYEGSEEANAVSEQIKNEKTWNLGNICPYLYLAVNHAFDRIYRNLDLFDRGNTQGTPPSTMVRLENIRDVVQIKPIDNDHFTLRVFYDKSHFDHDAEAIGLHTAQAFWNERERESSGFILIQG